LATLLDRPLVGSLSVLERAAPTPTDPVAVARRDRGGMTDRQTGLVALGVIAGVGLLLLAIMTAILVYSFGWGYAVQL
jgi:hypothetical protein